MWNQTLRHFHSMLMIKKTKRRSALPFHRQQKGTSNGAERRSDFISCSYLSLNCDCRSPGSFSFIQHDVTFDVHCVVKHDSTRLDVFTLRVYLSLSVRSLFFFSSLFSLSLSVSFESPLQLGIPLWIRSPLCEARKRLS